MTVAGPPYLGCKMLETTAICASLELLIFYVSAFWKLRLWRWWFKIDMLKWWISGGKRDDSGLETIQRKYL
jgi:hypothetical protein